MVTIRDLEQTFLTFFAILSLLGAKQLIERSSKNVVGILHIFDFHKLVVEIHRTKLYNKY